MTNQTTNMTNPMTLIATNNPAPALQNMLEGYDYPAILVSTNYEILATNRLYQKAFGRIDTQKTHHCFEVSHGYSVPCDQAGEDCPLIAARTSGHKERVLHIHQTPRGKEHVDVEMVPIFDNDGELNFFVELLRPIPIASTMAASNDMVGISPPFNKMLSQITRVGTSDASVLLLGESGAGKELAARAIHQASTRNDKAMVTLECAGLTESLFESELFGHVKGAFTGAHSNRKGLVELANGGTLFLDEIGDVPLGMQIKLLRLLESGTYRTVGSAEVKKADFRLLCATHKDILHMVNQGKFRQDLYYRINVFPIRIPSLRERQADIPVLATTLLQRISPNKELHLTDSAMQQLKEYPYPGNIRELRNLLNRAVVLTDTNLLDKNVIAESMEVDYTPTSHPNQAPFATTEADEWVDLKTAEQRYLAELMRAFSGNKEKVAMVANISLRSLYRKLKEANIIDE